MRCPFCGSIDTRVVNSRPSDEHSAIRRRRECDNCGRRFTTYERAQFEALMVVKRSGKKEAFNPDKLLSKLLIACNKRPITEKKLRTFVYSFEDQIPGQEIQAEDIGIRALKFLKDLDDVAYIRFLSVYRDFDSVERFIEEIKELENKESTPSKQEADGSSLTA
ncbi:MAG: transcriptional regulator NrdR [Deinococcota bacterium]